MPPTPLRALELYCGIGGFAAAVAEPDGTAAAAAVEIVGALDVNRTALAVYRENVPPEHRERIAVKNLEFLSARELGAFGADLWWLSPPCQPFTRRGLGRDADDRRSRSLLALLDHLEASTALRPRYLAIENVPGFAGSRCHARLLEVLDGGGYRWRELILCPTELGVPNRRQRWYLAASLDGELAAWDDGAAAPFPPPGPLVAYLDPELDLAPNGLAVKDLAVPGEIARRYEGALDVVDPRDPEAVTACFTAAYGRSHVRSGSYLRLPAGGARRFSPREILHLLGFPESYKFPPDLPHAKAWPLAGNSLSVPAVKTILGAFPRINTAAGTTVGSGAIAPRTPRYDRFAP